ncbi:MAG: hypothetical protein EA392_14515, partial [Cryomorphaceae bacterium]
MVNAKTILHTTLLMIAALLFFLQAEAQYFNKRIDFMGLDMPENGFSIELMIDGNYILFNSGRSINYELGLGRTIISPQGEVLFEHFNLDETGPLYTGTANTSTKLLDGTFVSSGSRGWYDSELESMITLNKYHEDGSIEWIQLYGDSINQSIGRAATEQPFNKNLACVGSINIPPVGNGDVDAFVLITDSIGNMVQLSTFGGNGVDEFLNICPTIDGGYLLGGYTRSYNSQGNIDHFVVKTDSAGNEQWSKVIGTPREDSWADVLQSSDANYVFCGSWNEYTIGGTEHYTFPYISKLDSAGDLIWEHTYEDLFEGSNYYTKLRIVKELENEDLISIGERAGANLGIMLRTDKDGNVIWYREFMHPTTQSYGAANIINDVIPDGEGGFVCGGWLYGSPLDSIQGQDLWVFRTDSMGCLVPGCHLVDNVEVHEEEVLVSMYPNPVQDLLSVHLKSGPMPRGAQLELYDMHGRHHSTTTINPGATT